MRRRYALFALISFGVVVAVASLTTNAAELKVQTARLGLTVLREIGPVFERETGHRLEAAEIYGPELLKRIDAGEPVDTDVLILRFDFVDALIAQGRLRADTRTDLMKTGIGVEVRTGAPKPDIGSIGAFKRALLNARSIAYLANGVESAYLDNLLVRLGVAEAVKAKLTRPERDVVSTLVAKGDIELGIAIVTQILTTPGVELVGPLPREIQSYYVFRGAVGANSKAPEAATELLRFLKGPAAIQVIRSQGMEPG